MPFLDQLHHWARLRPGHDAVITGNRRLSYAQLAAAADARAAARRGGAPILSILEEADAVQLAPALCAAVADGGVAAVLDPAWPAPVRSGVREAALAWADGPLRDTVAAAEPFLLGFSSGTSGLPKAFHRSRASWRTSIAASNAHFGLSADDLTLAPGPSCASMNLYALAECLASGSTFVSLERFSARAALAAIEKHAVTRLVLVPSVLALITSAAALSGHRATGLTSIVCAGSALPAQTLATAAEWAPNAAITQYYGAAELGFVAAWTPGGPGGGEPGVGHLFPGVEAVVADVAGNPLPAGAAGTIHVRSPYVAGGYAWGAGGSPFSTVLPGCGPDPWFTVRDQGFFDGGGRLHVLGRESEMVLVAGANVYPQAVESVLGEGARDGAVVATGVSDPVRGARIAVGLDIREPTFARELAAGTVPAAVRSLAVQLPAAHRPGAYYALSELPLTRSGKASRSVLSVWLEGGDARARRVH